MRKSACECAWTLECVCERENIFVKKNGRLVYLWISSVIIVLIDLSWNLLKISLESLFSLYTQNAYIYLI